MPRGPLALVGALAGLVAGILLSDAGVYPDSAWLPLAMTAVVALAILPFRWGRLGGVVALAAALSAGMAAGILRAPASELPVGPGSVHAAIGPLEWRVEGTVTDEPQASGRRVQAILDDVRLEPLSSTVASAGGGVEADGRLIVWAPRAVELASGDRIAFVALLEAPRDFDGFAYREYLARRGIAAMATAYEIEVVSQRSESPADVIMSLRDWLLDGLQAAVPEPAAALGAGILLGVRSGIGPDVEDAFETSGLTHVVAISGWNIAIVGAAVAAATSPIRRSRGGRWSAPLVLIGAIAFYVVLTGATPSVVRAALMAGAALVARQAGSRAHAASALMLAAAVMLLAAPSVLWDIGFQLSLLATAGLIAVGEPISARLSRLPGAIREPVALTLAAQLFTLPVILLNFERLSLVAPAANVLVAPLVPLAMAASALAALVGAADAASDVPLIGDALVWLAGGAAWLYLSGMIGVADLAASVPFAAVDLAPPGWLPLVYYPFVLVTLALHRRGRRGRPGEQPALELQPLDVSTGASRPAITRWPRVAVAVFASAVSWAARPVPLLAATLLGVAACSVATAPDGRLHVTALDIGQGDAILVEAPGGGTLLVDGGPDPDLTLQRLAEQLLFRVRSIDVVLLTHPHEDHVAGLIEVLDRYVVGTVIHPGRAYEGPALPRFLAGAGRAERVAVARAGQRVHLGEGVMLEILFPTEHDAAAPLPEGDINNASIVARLRYGEFDALLTGDAEAPVERLLLDRGVLEPVDVLKVGHHGSESSTTPEFLAAIAPRIALISSGAGNEYGHPAPATLATLAAHAGLVTYRTDLLGSIEVVADGRRVWIAAGGRQPQAIDGVDSSIQALGAGVATIGPWSSRVSMPPASCCSISASRTASSPTARASAASPSPPRGSSPMPAYRSIERSSRSPPCSTTSTSCRPAAGRAATARWARAISSDSDIPSWRHRFDRTRCAA